MPIKLIQQFAKRNASLFTKVTIPNKSKIAIDGDALLYHLFIQCQNFSFGGDNDKLYQATVKFFQSLQNCEISATVFLPLQETETDPQILSQKLQIYEELLQQYESDDLVQINKSARGFRFNPAHRPTFVQALRDQKIDFICVHGSVAPFCASYAIAEQIPVLGYDSAYFGYDLKFYFIESLYFDDEFHQSKMRYTESKNEVQCLAANSSLIAEYLKITHFQLQLLLRMLPNDYLSELNDFRQSFEATVHGKDPKDNIIFGLASLIIENDIQDENKLIEVVLLKNSQIFEESKNKKQELIKAIESKILTLKQELEKLKKAEKTEFVLGNIENTTKNIQILSDQKESIVQQTQLNNDLIKKQLKDSALIFQLKSIEEGIQGTFQPAWLKSFFKFGKLPVFLYQALVQKETVFLPAIEIISKNSSQQSQVLRKHLYELCSIKQVTEYQKENGKMVAQILKLNESKVNLAKSVKLSVKERQKIVLQLILNDDKLVDTVQQQIIEEKQFQAAALISFFQNYQCECDVAAAIVTSALFPINQNIVYKQLQSQQVNKNLDCLHAIAVYQNILEACIGLNAIFGSPLAIQLNKLVSSSTTLLQHINEKENESVLRNHYKTLTSGQIPEDYNHYLKKQRTSQKLSKSEIQMCENIENFEVVHHLLVQFDCFNCFNNYTSSVIDNQEDQQAKEYEEKQLKKMRAGDLQLKKSNKFAGLEQEE